MTDNGQAPVVAREFESTPITNTQMLWHNILGAVKERLHIHSY